MNESQCATLVSAVEQAWNTHDIASYADYFAEDGYFVNVGGWWWRGRTEIRDNHAALHDERFRNSVMDLELAFKRLTDQVAAAREVAHVRSRCQRC